MHLALYCFANSQLSTALNLLYRARYLMLLVFGEDHPEMALLDVSSLLESMSLSLTLKKSLGLQNTQAIWTVHLGTSSLGYKTLLPLEEKRSLTV